MQDVDQVRRGVRIFGRQAELAAISQLLVDRFEHVHGVLLEGEAGIGKSTVWAAGVEVARAAFWTVLSARGSQSETGLSFAGLADLLDPVADDVIDELAEPQRAALEVALVRRLPDGASVGAREVGAAVLAVLRTLCRRGPVLLAVDDAQWLDNATLETLSFALCRLDGVPLRILASRRTPGGVVDDTTNGPPIRGLDAISVGPLDATIVRQLLADRLDLTLPARVVDGLVAQTRGNPFWVLELGATLRAARTGAPASIPQSLALLVSRRLDGLAAEPREALLAVSALPQPSVSLAVRALASRVNDPAAAIDAAVTGGVVVESEGRLRPAHPLLGSAALDALPPVARRALHARLASIVVDAEQRARHQALAARGEPDEAVAASLDAGAAVARSRGAIHAAAELADEAVTFTPPDDRDALPRRHLTAAELYHQAGDFEHALPNAEAGWRVDAAHTRHVLPLLVESAYWLQGTQAAQQIVSPLIADEQLDVHTRAVALAMAADVGDGADTPRGVLAQRALDLFAQVGGEPDALSLSTALLYLAFARLDAGDGIAFDLMNRADALQRGVPYVPAANRSSYVVACWYRSVDDLDRSRTALADAVAEARDQGEDSVLPGLNGNLALSEVWAGRYESAREAIALGWQVWNGAGAAPLALKGADVLLRVLTGDIVGARAFVADRLAQERNSFHDADRIVYGQVLGLAALLEGDAEQAVEQLSTAYRSARESGKHEPGRRHRLEGDLGQALVATGRLEEATALAKEQLALGERSGRPTLLGVGHRIEGLVLAAQGDLRAAADALNQAVAEHERSPLPLERGRSLLALGQVLRRRKVKGETGQVFQAALDCFTALGATPFARLAQAELDRTQRSRSGAVLTTSERQVAELVANGATNREVAARLFTSIRTVEGHLSSIYRKLGVRSRSELAKSLPARIR